jgi:hypothetical protein
MQRSTITEWRCFRAWVEGWRSLGDVLSRQFWPLNGEALCAKARLRTGLVDFSGANREPEARSLMESMDAIRAFRKAHPEFAGRFIDVHYDELVSDPLEVVRHIFQGLNRHLAEPASEKMQQLAARRSRYKGRRGSPTLADLGVDVVFESQRLAACCSQCKVSEIDFSSFSQQG